MAVFDGILTSMLYIWFLGAFIFYCFAYEKEKKWLLKVPSLVFKITKCGLVILFMGFIIFLGFCCWGMNKTCDEPLDYLIVLGGGVDVDEPSLSLKLRLERAKEYADANPETKIIGTGSIGIDPKQRISEGQCIYNWLLENGISNDRIIKEEKATSTRENFKYSLELTEKYKPLNVGVVTSNFHVFRAMCIAQKIAEEDTGYTFYGISADFPLYLLPHYTIREFCATTLYILRGDLSLPK